uniref:Ring finger protein 115 n=1 Tax=Nothobranchius furzeri TaxID=105023 RepID=A0A1A7Z717_NOTFU
MAEAAPVPPHRFFCHCCKGEVNPKLPEYICPRCDSGFIEEVTEDSSLLESGANGMDDSATQFAELWHLLFLERPFTPDRDSPDSEPRLPGGRLGGFGDLGGLGEKCPECSPEVCYAPSNQHRRDGFQNNTLADKRTRGQKSAGHLAVTDNIEDRRPWK